MHDSKLQPTPVNILLSRRVKLWPMDAFMRATHPSWCAAAHTSPPAVRQTDRKVHNRCLTAGERTRVRARTHMQKADTPRHSQPLALFTHGHYSSAAVNPIIPQIPASWDYFMCFGKIIVLCLLFRRCSVATLVRNADWIMLTNITRFFEKLHIRHSVCSIS